jgi:hypothetical protein
VRRCGPTEQCLRLGPSGYSCSSGRRVAKPDSHTYSYSNSTSESDPYTEQSGRFAYAVTYADSYSDGDAKGGAKASADAAPQTVRMS